MATTLSHCSILRARQFPGQVTVISTCLQIYAGRARDGSAPRNYLQLDLMGARGYLGNPEIYLQYAIHVARRAASVVHIDCGQRLSVEQ